jgi:hypothetical protein
VIVKIIFLAITDSQSGISMPILALMPSGSYPHFPKDPLVKMPW